MVLWSYKTIIDSRLLSINMLWLILNKTSCDRNLIQLELGWWHNWWSMLHIICGIRINFRRKACFCWRAHGEKADSWGGLNLIEGLVGCTLFPLSLVGLKCCHWFTGVLFSPHRLQLTRSNKSLKFGNSIMVTHVILNIILHYSSNILTVSLRWRHYARTDSIWKTTLKLISLHLICAWLKYKCLNKMVSILWTTVVNAFSSRKIFAFWFKFQLSLFLGSNWA